MTLTTTCTAAADADELQFLELLAEVPAADFLAVLQELVAVGVVEHHATPAKTTTSR